MMRHDPGKSFEKKSSVSRDLKDLVQASHCDYKMNEEGSPKYLPGQSFSVDSEISYKVDMWCEKFQPRLTSEDPKEERIYVYFEYRSDLLQQLPDSLVVSNYANFFSLGSVGEIEDAFSLVIEDSDSYTGVLHATGRANDEFHFIVKAYEPLISSKDKSKYQEFQSFLQMKNSQSMLRKDKKISPR
jgi:hypothetical protein